MEWVTLWILISVGCVVSISSLAEDNRYGMNKTESKIAQITPRPSTVSSDDEFGTIDEDPPASARDYLNTEPNAASGNFNKTSNVENDGHSTNNTEDDVEGKWRRLSNKYGFNPYANTRRIINNYALSKMMSESQPHYYRRMLGRLDNINSKNNFGKGIKKKSKQPESAVSNIREVREKLFDHVLNYVRGISVEDLIQNGTGSLDDKLTNYYDVAIGVNEKNRDEVSSKNKYIEISAENESGENVEENSNEYEFEGYNHAAVINADSLSNEDREQDSKSKLYYTTKKSNDTLEAMQRLESTTVKNVIGSHNSNEIDDFANRTSENYENNIKDLKPRRNKTQEYIGMNNISNDKNRVQGKQPQNNKYINVSTEETDETSYQAKELDSGNAITKINQIKPSRTENITTHGIKYHGKKNNESNAENNEQKHTSNKKQQTDISNNMTQVTDHFDKKQKEHFKISEKDKHQTSNIKTPDYKSHIREHQENQIESIQINSKQNKDKHVKATNKTEKNKINKSVTINGTECNKINNDKLDEDDANGRRSQAAGQGQHNYGINTYRQNTKDESGRIHLHLDFEIS